MFITKSGLVVVMLAGLAAVGEVGRMGLVASAYAQPSSSSSPSASAGVLINEVESNPKGKDNNNQWVELYNPTSREIPIGNFKVKT
jgi:hypothetical protein